jgi:hypothetical protein
MDRGESISDPEENRYRLNQCESPPGSQAPAQRVPLYPRAGQPGRGSLSRFVRSGRGGIYERGNGGMLERTVGGRLEPKLLPGAAEFRFGQLQRDELIAIQSSVHACIAPLPYPFEDAKAAAPLAAQLLAGLQEHRIHGRAVRRPRALTS